MKPVATKHSAPVIHFQNNKFRKLKLGKEITQGVHTLICYPNFNNTSQVRIPPSTWEKISRTIKERKIKLRESQMLPTGIGRDSTTIFPTIPWTGVSSLAKTISPSADTMVPNAQILALMHKTKQNKLLVPSDGRCPSKSSSVVWV